MYLLLFFTTICSIIRALNLHNLIAILSHSDSHVNHKKMFPAICTRFRLNQSWSSEAYPQLHVRMGINKFSHNHRCFWMFKRDKKDKLIKQNKKLPRQLYCDCVQIFTLFVYELVFALQCQVDNDFSDKVI